MSESVLNLANHFLIAMPQLEDEFFARSVVYVCEHNERGALELPPIAAGSGQSSIGGHCSMPD